MADRVANAQHQLEARVEERTRELTDALKHLRDAQDQLVRQERLAILGQLAGGVGHELRNPLGVMTNAIYYLEAVLTDQRPEVKEYLGILQQQVGLSEKIVSDLLDFARIKPPSREVVALDTLLDHQINRLAMANGVRVERDLPADLPPAFVDPVQVGQVVLNLLTNAVEAVGEHGGRLVLRARHEPPNLRLEVADSGPGIAPSDLDKIFEPLFTTKPRGIGLGLAVSRGLARSNGGEITVASPPGEGARFTLTLPTTVEPRGVAV